MVSLDSDIWKNLRGGYKNIYDVSVPLKKLEAAINQDELDEIWAELWQELHHQGDVGIASYLAVPQLVRIAVAKNIYDWNLFQLCTIIEQQRHLGDNPQLPEEYQAYYNDGLQNLKNFIIANIGTQKDELTFRMELSTLAVCAGHIKLSKAIGELEGCTLDDFLEQF